MTYCAVKGCHNSSHNHQKQLKIPFHGFPSDPTVASRWVEKLRLNRKENFWKPTKYTKICSLHFDEKDKYITKGGLCKLREDAIPTKGLHIFCTEESQKINDVCNDTTSHDSPKLDKPQLGVSANEASENADFETPSTSSSRAQKYSHEPPSFLEKYTYETGVFSALLVHEIDNALHEKLSMIEAITEQTSDSEQSCSENVNTNSSSTEAITGNQQTLEQSCPENSNSNSSSIEVITGHEETLKQSCSQNLNSSLLEVPRIQEEQADEAEIFYITLNQHQTLEQASSQNSYFCLNQSLPNAVSPPEQSLGNQEPSLPLLRERFLKYKLTKMQKVTQNQKKKIKSLNQKLKRVQNRNKRLIDMLKTLKKRINLI